MTTIQLAPLLTKCRRGSPSGRWRACGWAALGLVMIAGSVVRAQSQQAQSSRVAADAQALVPAVPITHSLNAPVPPSAGSALIVRRLPPLTNVVKLPPAARTRIRDIRVYSTSVASTWPTAHAYQPTDDRTIQLTSGVQSGAAPAVDLLVVRRLPPLVAVVERSTTGAQRKISPGQRGAVPFDAHVTTGAVEVLAGSSQFAGQPIYLGPPPEPAADNRAGRRGPIDIASRRPPARRAAGPDQADVRLVVAGRSLRREPWARHIPLSVAASSQGRDLSYNRRVGYVVSVISVRAARSRR